MFGSGLCVTKFEFDCWFRFCGWFVDLYKSNLLISGLYKAVVQVLHEGCRWAIVQIDHEFVDFGANSRVKNV